MADHYDGDLRALALLDAFIREDSEGMDVLVSGEIEAEELSALVRCLCVALGVTLEKNLGQQGALQQVAMWRQEFLVATCSD